MDRRLAPIASTRPRLLLLAVCAALLVGACGERKDRVALQAAAKVNGEAISVQQVDLLLQQQRGLRAEHAEAAGRQILERLIDHQLALQRADELGLERDPRVAQQLEVARREALARAYVERVGEAAAKPTADEILKYYDDHPALFAQRRVYSLQEIAIEARPEQVAGLRDRLAASQNVLEFVEYLKANDFRFGATQAVRAAEQLPLASLEALSRLRDGQAMVVPTPNGMQVIVLGGSRELPVSLEQARPAIEALILNERKRKLVEDNVRALRAAAKIDYLGKFAARAASAPGGEPAAKPMTAASAAN